MASFARQKKTSPNIAEMTTEELRKTLIKKRKCNARAQHIVEVLIEENISEELFLKLVPEINQSHLDDIFEERAILNLCGYPVCSNKLDAQSIPKQQYRISTKTNKVYDISVRKRFCSNNCYKAAVYIKSQMFTSPLWFREQEDLPEFQLLKIWVQGSLGDVLDISINEKVKIKNEAFSSIFDFAEASLNDIPHSNKSDDEYNSNESPEKEIEKSDPISKTVEKSLTKNKQPESSCAMPDIIIKDIVEKFEDIELEQPKHLNEKETLSSIKKVAKAKLSMTDVSTKVEQSLNEWITIETMLYIYGKEKLKEMVGKKSQNIRKYLDKLETSNENPHYKSQYEEICRKLTLLEFQDKQFDFAIKDEKSLNPLPDYSSIKKDGKNLELKVKAFYSGSTQVSVIEDDVKGVNKSEKDLGNTTQLPLIDKKAQTALRRRIVMNHLNKTLADVFISLGLPLSLKPDLKQLVYSFNLKANNITFNPMQWYLIGLVIIELFSIKEDNLSTMLQKDRVKKIHNVLISKFHQDELYFMRLVQRILDIERIFKLN